MDVEVFRRLDRRSAPAGAATKSSLAERYIDEGMRMEDHPGIVFRDGPAGRRASLTRGPDVWEVIAVVRDQPSSGDPALEGAAEWLDLPVADIKTSLAYYGDFKDEIDERLRRNEEAAREAEAAWRRGQAAIT